MIFKNDIISTGLIKEENCLEVNGIKDIYKDAIFFDLEHYVYKKPICIGVFGACYFKDDKLHVTQYMIENKKDNLYVIKLAQKYFKDVIKKHNKKYIVTFSGNNDFTVIRYLFKKYNIDFDVENSLIHVDLQKKYSEEKKECIGLKALEKVFNIERQGEVIKGTTLSKTFSKIMKDSQYINRMPKEKTEKILIYNEQDVVNLFYIMTSWKEFIK